MTRLTARQRKYRDLLTPLALDRTAVSVLLCATVDTRPSAPERLRIAHDLYAALEDILRSHDREAVQETKKAKGTV